MRLHYFIVTLSLTTYISAFAQGSFQNLDFEAANPIPTSGSFIDAASGLPGWTVLIGNTAASQILYNAETIGEASVDLLSPPWPVIAGQYSVVLQSGEASPTGGPLVPVSISQTGTIPANAKSLEFDAYDSSSLLSVSFAGAELSSVVLGSGRSASGVPYNIYGANISSFAGQTGQLEFFANLTGNVELDNISFSGIAVVPEPPAAALIGFASIAFALVRLVLRRLHN
jgi:hypothetical protein